MYEGRAGSVVIGMSARCDVQCSTPGRAALLIDLDNITIAGDGAMPPADAERLLLALVEAAGPVQWRLAVAPLKTIERYGSTLAKLGIRWSVVPCLPDAADAEIVAIAKDLADRGYDQYVVASADGYFAAIAKFGRLRSVTRAGQPVSWRLKASADRLVAA